MGGPGLLPDGRAGSDDAPVLAGELVRGLTPF